MPKGAELITEFPVEEKIPYVFGICGNGNVGMLDALYDARSDIKLISPRHEQAAAHMADGYFRIKHEAVATLTSCGPGSANLVMGTFILMLLLTSVTGLALLVLRATPSMGMLLAVHLGVVFALFLTLPYSKFVHGIYRHLALVRYARERFHHFGEPSAKLVPAAATTGQGGQRK